MGKSKKKKAKENLISIDLDSPQSLSIDMEGSVKSDLEHRPHYQGILTQRLEDRVIPMVDDGIKEKDLKNPPPEAVEAWYAYAHVGQYVHMEQVVNMDGSTYMTKRVQFEFSRMLDGYSEQMDERGVNPSIERLSFATISKVSFVNNIANPLRYTNYFIEYFDDDDELMRAYFQLMYQIMHKKIDLDPVSFIESIHALFTTDTMIEKLYRMVEYNTDMTLIKKADKVYDESIQLTVEHLKAIMGISCLHKFAIPIVNHYYSTRSNLLEKAKMSAKDLYYAVFMSFISVFDDVYNINLHNKLYHTSTTRITKTTNQETEMWNRRKRLGTTPVSYTNDLMRDFVIDISQKEVFSKSAIVFIHVCMDNAIHNTLIQSDKYDYVDMTMEPSDSVNETISRFDRMQTDKSHHSEQDRIRSRVVNKDSLYRLGLEFGLDFAAMESKKQKQKKKVKKLIDEFNYYLENIPRPMNDTQIYIIKLWYASYVGNTVDGNSLEFRDLIKLIMIMKREFRQRNLNYLALFISSRVNATTNKTKYNKRRVERLILDHSLYEDLIGLYKDTEDYLNWDKMLSEIKVIIACPIETVDYEYQHLEGKSVSPYEDDAIDEIMRFYYSL